MRSGPRLAPWIAGALVVQRLGEVRFAKGNERAARERGAVEFGARHYPLFFVLHPAWLVGLVAESRAAGRRVSPGWLAAAILMQPLRVSTMRLLGPQWTTRVLITPGARRVDRGLYRWFKHPAYAAVTVELLATPLAVGARRTALGGSVANLALLGLLRLPAERRAEATRTPAP
ncbi:MAG: isoprenylcysteine carboxylmethyltransferase family protein [Solirubrobacteraceae bacterium]|nr:isoprenylcysteine carboxylmethyltransferase family protein [Patulibacter sp.]